MGRRPEATLRSMERDGGVGSNFAEGLRADELRTPKSWFFERPACLCVSTDDDELLNPSKHTLRSSARLRARSAKLQELAADADRLAQELDERQDDQFKKPSMQALDEAKQPLPSSCSMFGSFFAIFLAGSMWNYSLFILIPVLSAAIVPE